MAKTKTVKEPKNMNAVNDALHFPLGDAFEKALGELMQNDTLPVVIALIDLDCFLPVNEKFGFETGDRVLIETGRHLAAKTPEGTEIYRISGDEFGILFHNGMEKEDVFLLMEEIRRTLDVTLPDQSKVSVSIGIATAFEDANRVPELMRKAESALFRVKQNGRNKVALAREEKMIPKTSHYTADQLQSLTKLSKREGIGEAILLREALDMLLKKYDV